MKKRLVLAIIATASTVPAFAQTALKPVPRSEYIKNLDNRFTAMDTNHDGKITLPEMAAQQQREIQAAKGKLQEQLITKFKQLDTNKDGQLGQQEFLAAMPAVRTGETPQQLLQRFDGNRDGVVSQEEFRAPEIAKFNKIDANRDGTVSPAEIQAVTGKK